MRKTINIFPFNFLLSGCVFQPKLKTFLVVALTFIVINLSAQNNTEATYLQTITQRSQKIVATLNVTDSAKFYRVQNIIVDQYKNLNTAHETCNAKIKVLKADTTIDKKVKSDKLNAIEEERLATTGVLHKSFLEKLSKELTQEQIVQVKDGMTYSILPVTYKAYNEMLPQLTEEQKKKIYDWLVEAREYAMDAESSEKKHAWFGKYKGRINNYLSSTGIDMKKEEAEWQKRIKEKNISNKQS